MARGERELVEKAQHCMCFLNGLAISTPYPLYNVTHIASCFQECMARGEPELVEKVGILAKHCLCHLYGGAMFPPDPIDEEDEELVEEAESARSDVENLGKFVGSVNLMVRKIFLGNVPDALGKICSLC